MSLVPSSAAVYLRIAEVVDRITLNVSAAVQGIALGLFDDAGLDSVADQYYSKRAEYFDPGYNERGLFDWEAATIHPWYLPEQSIIVLGAGGGREVLALARQGLAVRGFECLPQLVAEGNRFLEKLECGARIDWCAPSVFPDLSTKVDHAIVGWGSYTHIRGSVRRVSLLRQIHGSLNEDGTVLVSFWPRSGVQLRFHAIAKIANALRRWRGVTEKIEVGDSMFPLYVHHFRKGEIEDEFGAAGFDLVHFGLFPYGHALGKRRDA